MRKLFAILLSVLLLCACAAGVSAEAGKYKNAGELYEAWCEELPDYICGVWSTDGGTENLTFGVQNNEAGNAGKLEMLELVEDDSSLTFVYQVFGRNALLEIQRQIDEYFEKDLGLIYTGLDEINNCIQLGILEERKSDGETKNMIREITGKYGDAVRVEYTGEIHAMTAQNRGAKHMGSLPVWIGLLVLVAGAFMAAQGRRLRLLQTHSGAAVSGGAAPSVREVTEAVREAKLDVPPELDRKILAAVEKKK